MGLFDKLFGKKEIESEDKGQELSKPKKQPKVTKADKTPKEIATENREPWVAVLNTSINPRDPRNGFFELDWNEYFIDQLRFSGYKGDNDEELIDRWFKDLCMSVAAEDQELLDNLAQQNVQSKRKRKPKNSDTEEL